jgi:hypothetical protein
MNKDLIYPTEKSVYKAMKENNIAEVTMYHTAYVDDSNYQTWGYTLENVNSDYYLNQKCIRKKTQKFVLLNN